MSGLEEEGPEQPPQDGRTPDGPDGATAVDALEVADDEYPETLYHYTNQEGLLGIIESRFVFATKIQYFNDSAEFHLTLDLAAAIVRDRIDTKITQATARELENDIDGIRHANIFAISLSEEPDLLSQWRAYGGPGSSFALGLDTNVLNKIANDVGWVLDQCIYNPTDHRRLVGAAVTRAIRSGAGAGDALRALLAAIAPVNKHASFEEEKEWRISSPPLPEELHFEFRSGKFTPVPYVMLPLATHQGVSAIKEIVVGPTPHRDLSIMAIAALLRRENIPVPVKASQTTFRDW